MGTWNTISLSGTMMPDADGFEQNIMIENRQQRICGDVDELHNITTNGGKQICMNLLWQGAISAGVLQLNLMRVLR